MRRKKIGRFIARKAPHLLLLATLFAVSAITGLYLPKRIPLHWDKQGIVDRIGPKYELILLLPCAAVIVFAVGVFAESRFILPSRKMRGFIAFTQFFFLVLIFVLQAKNLLQAGNIQTPIERLTPIPALLLYAYVAGVLGDAEYQSIFGVKTKWTMNSPAVWEKTNRLASRLFQCSAAMMLVPLFVYRLFYLFLLLPPALSFIISAAYSKIISKSGGGGEEPK